MMKMWMRWAALSVMVLAMGCSSVSVNNDWDRDASFGTYKTYAWMPRNTNTASGDARLAERENSLLDKRIKRAVDTQMAAKGFTIDTASPDLFLVYHTGLQDKITVTDYGYRYSYDYWGYGGRDIDVYQYTEGTLIIDMIESESKELVWRSSATGTVDPGSSSQKQEANINSVVERMMSAYPPRN